MYRFAGLLFVLVLAGCGGGGASENPPFGGKATSTATPSEQVLGARNEATPTLTPQPTAPAEYTVVEGDTLSEIGQRFGKDVAEIVSLNGLDDADSLFVGQVLKLSGTPVAATPTPTATQ